MIRYVDGSVLAQLGQPDMRTPIAYSLGWPERIDAGVEALDLISAGRLDFEPPDQASFPCLALAQSAVRENGGMCIFNAANEMAVAAFLRNGLRFTDIPIVIAAAIESLAGIEPDSVEAVEDLDARTRRFVDQQLSSGF